MTAFNILATFLATEDTSPQAAEAGDLSALVRGCSGASLGPGALTCA